MDPMRNDGRSIRSVLGAAAAALVAGGLLSLSGCGKEEKPEPAPPPPPPPPRDTGPALADPVNLQQVRSSLEVDARVQFEQVPGELAPGNRALAEAIYELASAFAAIEEHSDGSELRPLLDQRGRELLNVVVADGLFDLGIEAVRVVYVDPATRRLADPKQSKVVLAIQTAASAAAPGGASVLVFDAKNVAGSWVFSPEASTGEVKRTASAWDGLGLDAYGSTMSLDFLDEGAGLVPGLGEVPEIDPGAPFEPERDRSTVNTPGGPVRIPGSGG
ncbi:MAG: hypothetical protein ACF8SC_10800 [Phycisphaerales bacterium JB037]